MSPNFCRAAAAPVACGQRFFFIFNLVVIMFLCASLPSLFAEEPESRSVHHIKVSTALAPATVGAPYSETISLSGATPPYQFVPDNLPPGMTLNPTTGQISGTPQSEGPFGFSVEVFDAKGKHKSQKMTLAVGSQMGVSISL